MRRAIVATLALLAVPFAYAQNPGPIQLKQPSVLINPGPKPVLTPNLVIDAFGWNAEFCGLYGCAAADQMRQDLKINKATCDLRVYVRNTGAGKAGAFSVRVTFTHWKGDALLQRDVSVGEGLAAGASKVVTIPANQIGYYHTGKPFTAIVDAANQVAESNEGDNTKTIPNP